MKMYERIEKVIKVQKRELENNSIKNQLSKKEIIDIAIKYDNEVDILSEIIQKSEEKNKIKDFFKLFREICKNELWEELCKEKIIFKIFLANNSKKQKIIALLKNNNNDIQNIYNKIYRELMIANYQKQKLVNILFFPENIKVKLEGEAIEIEEIRNNYIVRQEKEREIEELTIKIDELERLLNDFARENSFYKVFAKYDYSIIDIIKYILDNNYKNPKMLLAEEESKKNTYREIKKLEKDRVQKGKYNDNRYLKWIY